MRRLMNKIKSFVNAYSEFINAINTFKEPELKLKFIDCIPESREDIVRERALKILEENGIEDARACLYGYGMASGERIQVVGVIIFAYEYGCTVDYLLGRTDTPYYTM